MAMEKHFIQEGKIRSEMDSFLRKELSKAVYCGMDIHKTPLAVRINLYVEKPPLVIGKKGRRINKLTRMLEQKYKIENLAIDVQRVDNPVLNSEVIARRVATALERRMYRRRVVYRAIRAIMSAGARGVEITLSGKIIGKGGRSRTEKYSEGYMKKAGDSTKLVNDASTQAYLKAGVIGVSVKIVPPDAVFPDQITIIKPQEEVAEVAEKEKKEVDEGAVKKESKKKESGKAKEEPKKVAKEGKAKKEPKKKAVKAKKEPKKVAKEGKAKEEKESKKEGVDLLAGNISDIKKQLEVMDDADYGNLIKAEKKGSNRKSLIAWLESRRSGI
ncbi:MAG: 30S ribosomal protein S3 [Candidatus Altiarchaeota archaeon]|nr:30S ribosomal protein S3 [Candidatus Altiarchaeota archaeon]